MSLYINSRKMSEYGVSDDSKIIIPTNTLELGESIKGSKNILRNLKSDNVGSVDLVYKFKEGEGIFQVISKISHDFYYEDKVLVQFDTLEISFYAYISVDIKAKVQQRNGIKFTLNMEVA